MKNNNLEIDKELQRKEIKETISDNCIEYLVGNIDQIIETLQGMKNKFGDRYHKIEIEDISYYNNSVLLMYGFRNELDEEYKKRITKNKKDFNKKLKDAKNKKEALEKQIKELERFVK